MNFFLNLWLAILVLGLALETFALIRDGKGDTLSEQIWRLLESRKWRTLIFGIWFWLTWHFFIEPYMPWDWTHVPWDDFVVIALGMLVGAILPAQKWRKA